MAVLDAVGTVAPCPKPFKIGLTKTYFHMVLRLTASALIVDDFCKVGRPLTLHRWKERHQIARRDPHGSLSIVVHICGIGVDIARTTSNDIIPFRRREHPAAFCVGHSCLHLRFADDAVCVIVNKRAERLYAILVKVDDKETAKENGSKTECDSGA